MEPTKRIRHACSRCRHQKLRCDDQRPCPLCVRAGAECVEATQRTWRSNRPKSAAYQARKRQLEERRYSARPAQQSASQGREARLHSATDSSPTDNIEQEDAVPPNQRASALHLVGKIFQKYHAAGSNRNHKVDAIPSSDSPEDGSEPAQSEMVPVDHLIGISLPPPNVATALLDSYRDAIHWYIRVHHEPSFRARLKPILETGLASRQQRPLLLLALIVMVCGARCISFEEKENIDAELSVADMASSMFNTCERWFLPLMDSVTVDTVIYSYLLATHYLWTRQTRAAFLTLGATVRAAQFIGLNQEAQWGDITDMERETRRCAWWSVFIGVGFISMSWGTPPMLSETDCRVGQPTDVRDSYTLERCPGFESTERREDGELRPVTVGSYNRYKAEMYKVAISMMRHVYFGQHRKPEDLIPLISNLHQKLLALEKSIPAELRVDNHPIFEPEEGHDVSLRKIFAIQALTLRVSCDNMYICLFRPLISIGGVPRSLNGTRENTPGLASSQSGLSSVPSSFLSMAQQQCWTSAMRTSMVAQRSDIMKLSIFKFPAVHVGVHSFSAGVMLGLLALLSPLSARGQESKRGIARIIHIPKLTKLTTDIWSQMTHILTDLMHLIAAEETKALIANPTGIDLTETLGEPDTFGEPSNMNLEVNVDVEQRTEGPARRVANGASQANGADISGVSPPQISIPQPHGDDSNTEASQTPHHLAPAMLGNAYSLDQYNAQFDALDTSDFWLPPQPEWPTDPTQTMHQLWMWDGSIPYN